MHPIRINRLRNIQEPSFFEELAKAPKKLIPRQENEFYSRILSQFEEPNKINEKKGKRILEILCHCFYESEQRISTFVKQQHHLSLPYDDDRFTDQIFDIFYILAEKHPSAFDDQYELGPIFLQLARLNPRKVLIILNVLSNRFGEIETPWSVFDILFKCWRKFYKECPDSYITLIVYLCRLDQAFLQGRGVTCYNRIIQQINTESDDNIDLLKILYASVSKLYDCDPSISEEESTKKSKSIQKTVQSDVLLRHIQIESLQTVIISYLLRIDLDPNDSNIYKIIKIILKLAKTSDKACFVIFKLSENENISEFLIKNLSLWIIEPLTTQQNTIILLLIVMRNEKLRKKISSSSEIMDFISNTIKSETSFVGPLMKIMNRLDINEDFVNTFYENELITPLVSMAKKLEKDDQESCALLIFLIFSKVEYENDPPNFTSICNFIISVLKKQNANMNQAAAILLKFARFNQCKIFYKKKKLIDTLSEIEGDKTFRTIRKKIINEIS